MNAAVETATIAAKHRYSYPKRLSDLGVMPGEVQVAVIGLR